MKKIIVTIAAVIAIGVILVGTFIGGAYYGMMNTAEAYFEGMSDSINSLDVGETSEEFTLDGAEIGIDEEINFCIIRTK